MKPQPLTLASGMLALFVSILWGGNVVALKLGLDTVPPYWSAFWRMLAGSLAVALWAWSQGVRLRPAPGERGPFVALALMFFAQISCLNVGVNWTSPAYAVVLLNSHPVFTNLFGHFFASEDNLSGRRVAGLALAVGGMAFVAVGRPEAGLAPRPLLGNALMIVSAALLAIRVIYTRRLVQKIHPVRPVVWQMTLALPGFVLMAAALEPLLLKPLTWVPVAALAYQGPLIAGFCFVTWTTLLKTHSAGTLSMFAFLVPFFGVALSALVFREPIAPNLLLGAGLVTLGILIVTRQAKAQAEEKPLEAVEPAAKETSLRSR